MTPIAAVALLLLSAPQAPVSSPAVILWPGDTAVTRQSDATIVLKTTGLSVSEISVALRGVTLTPGAVRLGGATGAFLHIRVTLTPGLNTVEVLARGEKAAACQLLCIDPLEGPADVPLGFSPRNFHVRQTEAPCGGCHGKKGEEDCTTCHAGLRARAVVHPPVLEGQCDSCHGKAKADPSRLAVTIQPPALCVQCHEDIKAAMAQGPYRHGPAAAGDCTTCHSPHSSDYVFLLRKKPFDLCTSCHVEKTGGKHMISGFTFGTSHPVGAPGEPRREDPTRPGVEFSCMSCHDPHASRVPQMWRFDATERFWFCQGCHKK